MPTPALMRRKAPRAQAAAPEVAETPAAAPKAQKTARVVAAARVISRPATNPRARSRPKLLLRPLRRKRQPLPRLRPANPPPKPWKKAPKPPAWPGRRLGCARGLFRAQPAPACGGIPFRGRAGRTMPRPRRTMPVKPRRAAHPGLNPPRPRCGSFHVPRPVRRTAAPPHVPRPASAPAVPDGPATARVHPVPAARADPRPAGAGRPGGTGAPRPVVRTAGGFGQPAPPSPLTGVTVRARKNGSRAAVPWTSSREISPAARATMIRRA